VRELFDCFFGIVCVVLDFKSSELYSVEDTLLNAEVSKVFVARARNSLPSNRSASWEFQAPQCYS
jgi:hypothetical protein